MNGLIQRLLAAPRDPLLQRLLLWVNAAGAVFGYNWYVEQLGMLPVYTWPVVADSPLAVTGFALVMWLRLRGRPVPWVEMWSSLAVIKYGAWAALLWLASWSTGTPITAFDFFGLFLTHIGMVLQGVILFRHVPAVPRLGGLAIVGWFFANDFFDYSFGLHPTIPMRLFVWCAVSAVLLSSYNAWLGHRHWLRTRSQRNAV